MTSKKFKKFLYLIRKLYWFVARPKSRGVKCVIQFGNELLMIRNTYGHKRWTFPGGGIKKGETLEEAAKREVMEEVGIITDKLIFPSESADESKLSPAASAGNSSVAAALIFIGEFFIKAECRKDTVYCFKTSVNDKSFKIGEDEVAVAEWFHKDELPTDMSEYAKRVLSLLNQ